MRGLAEKFLNLSRFKFSKLVNLSFPSAIFSLGQELSVKPFSLLSTNPRNARSAYGGSKGRPAGDERHRQKQRVSFYVRAQFGLVFYVITWIVCLHYLFLSYFS